MTATLLSETPSSRLARIGGRAIAAMPLVAAALLIALQVREGAVDLALKWTPVSVEAALAREGPASGLLAWLLAGPGALVGVTGQGLLIGVLALVAAVIWSSGFKRLSDLGWVRATFVILLIASPMWQAILAAGAGAALATIGIWIACWGLFELRSAPGAPATMTIAMGLVAAAFASPIGAVFAGFATLFFTLAAPIAMLRRSVLGVAIALLFPLYFSILGLAFIRWTMSGEAISAPTFTAPLLHLATDDLVLAGLAAAGALIFCAPLVITVLASRLSLTTVAPAAAVTGCAVGAAVVSVLLGEPLILALAPAAVAPAVAAAWLPSVERAQLQASLILVLALAAGCLATYADASPKAVQWRDAMLGRDAGSQRVHLPAKWPEQSLPDANEWEGAVYYYLRPTLALAKD
jgi:hypothetical protein